MQLFPQLQQLQSGQNSLEQLASDTHEILQQLQPLFGEKTLLEQLTEEQLQEYVWAVSFLLVPDYKENQYLQEFIKLVCSSQFKTQINPNFIPGDAFLERMRKVFPLSDLLKQQIGTTAFNLVQIEYQCGMDDWNNSSPLAKLHDALSETESYIDLSIPCRLDLENEVAQNGFFYILDDNKSWELIIKIFDKMIKKYKEKNLNFNINDVAFQRETQRNKKELTTYFQGFFMINNQEAFFKMLEISSEMRIKEVDTGRIILADFIDDLMEYLTNVELFNKSDDKITMFIQCIIQSFKVNDLYEIFDEIDNNDNISAQNKLCLITGFDSNRYPKEKYEEIKLKNNNESVDINKYFEDLEVCFNILLNMKPYGLTLYQDFHSHVTELVNKIIQYMSIFTLHVDSLNNNNNNNKNQGVNIDQVDLDQFSQILLRLFNIICGKTPVNTLEKRPSLHYDLFKPIAAFILANLKVETINASIEDVMIKSNFHRNSITLPPQINSPENRLKLLISSYLSENERGILYIDQSMKNQELSQKVADQSQQIDDQSQQIDNQSKKIAELSKQIEEQSKQIAEQSKQIAEQSKQIAEQSKQIELFQQRDSKKEKSEPDKRQSDGNCFFDQAPKRLKSAHAEDQASGLKK